MSQRTDRANLPSFVVRGPQIPLLGQGSRSPFALSEADRIAGIRKQNDRTKHLAIVKPDRTLGAPWMDNYVGRRMSVYLCADCFGKYGRWYAKYNYVAVTAQSRRKLADCDGCGTQFTWCVGCHPHEKPAQYAVGSLSSTFSETQTIGEIL